MNCGDNEQCLKSKVQRKKHKTGVEQTRTSTKIRGRIRCCEGVNILC